MLSNAVKELQSAKQQLVAQITGLEKEAQQIDQALAALAGLSGGRVAPAVPAKRTMSAAGRKAMAAAAKKRWAKVKAGKTSIAKPAKAAKSAKQPKKMSELGRLKIKLGSLNRYGKTAEAAQVQTQIAELIAKTATP